MYQTASDALEAYIDRFEGKTHRRYYTRRVSDLLSPKPKFRFMDAVDRSLQRKLVNVGSTTSRELLNWVNSSYRDDLERTCEPAYQGQKGDLKSTSGDLSLSEKTINAYNTTGQPSYSHEEGDIELSTLPSPTPSENGYKIESENGSIATEVLVHSYYQDIEYPSWVSHAARSPEYPSWIDGLDNSITRNTEEEEDPRRFSSVSSLLKSSTRISRDREAVHRKQAYSRGKSYVNKKANYTMDDTASVDTEILLESSVYGSEPVNMGGDLHSPLYRDRKVNKILNESKTKLEKHHKSLLGRSVHGISSDISLNTKRQDPKKSLTLPNSLHTATSVRTLPGANSTLSLRHSRAKTASTPLSANRNVDVSRVSTDKNHWNSVRVPYSTSLRNSNEIVPKTRSPLTSYKTSARELSTLSERVPRIVLKDNSRPSTSTTAFSRKPEGGFKLREESRVDKHGYQADDISQLTSGYQSDLISFSPTITRTAAPKVEFTTRRIVETERDSTQSNSSVSTDKLVRQSPTGFKMHARNKTWDSSVVASNALFTARSHSLQHDVDSRKNESAHQDSNALSRYTVTQHSPLSSKFSLSTRTTTPPKSPVRQKMRETTERSPRSVLSLSPVRTPVSDQNIVRTSSVSERVIERTSLVSDKNFLKPSVSDGDTVRPSSASLRGRNIVWSSPLRDRETVRPSSASDRDIRPSSASDRDILRPSSPRPLLKSWRYSDSVLVTRAKPIDIDNRSPPRHVPWKSSALSYETSSRYYDYDNYSEANSEETVADQEVDHEVSGRNQELSEGDDELSDVQSNESHPITDECHENRDSRNNFASTFKGNSNIKPSWSESPITDRGERQYLNRRTPTASVSGTRRSAEKFISPDSKPIFEHRGDAESDIMTVDTELLLIQPPMPVVDASPSLTTASDNESTIQDTESESDSKLFMSLPSRGHSRVSFVEQVDEQSPPAEMIKPYKTEDSIYIKYTLNNSQDDEESLSPLSKFASTNPRKLVVEEKEQKDNYKLWEQPSSVMERSSLQRSEKDGKSSLIDSFINDCLESSPGKASEIQNGKISSQSKSPDKLSGRDHPGTVEALKHMLLNLQRTTGSQRDEDREHRQTKISGSGKVNKKGTEDDETSNLPGEESLIRAYHHLERLKTLINSRRDVSSSESL